MNIFKNSFLSVLYILYRHSESVINNITLYNNFNITI